MLSERRHVGVVVEIHRAVKLPLQLAADVDFTPARDVVRIQNLPTARIDTAGHADGHTQQLWLAPMSTATAWPAVVERICGGMLRAELRMLPSPGRAGPAAFEANGIDLLKRFNQRITLRFPLPLVKRKLSFRLTFSPPHSFHDLRHYREVTCFLHTGSTPQLWSR